MAVNTLEGNTSKTDGLIVNGGCVAEKSYVDSYSRIACIYRPNYIGDEAHKVITMAKKYIGYLEKKSNSLLENFSANAGTKNFNMFAQHAGQVTGSSVYVNGKPWCDMFVDDIMIRALGAKRAKQLLGDWSAYTHTSANLLKKTGATLISPHNTRFGDIIFFKNSTRICHTGFVTNGYIIPAATDDKFIFSHADFVNEVCKILGAKNAQQAFNKTITLSAKKNNKHSLVLTVQKRLKDLGYYTGVPDKIFGTLTTNAVNKYQKTVLGYKNPDGEITKGGRMWKTILGL